MQAAHKYARTQFPRSMSYAERLAEGLKYAWFERNNFKFFTDEDGANKPLVDRTSDKERAQIDFCKRTNVPLFALNFCSCGRDVYSGYSLEYVSNNHVTGCPFCHRSFVA